ncbi:hypothetical protein RJ640_028825 [Escallonia rubra]|uniref:SWIM-type domain-containing protein n=1 Tax=Escallonia rubra TaxID=112253 RepID=A0AA88RDC8_9ASTE|nr:hypothetical protein RJ640_028825 [Escallonia rubra]
MADTGRTRVVSHSFQSVEQIDVNECLTDYDILDTHVDDEVETDDYDVWGLLHCDDKVETRKENEGYESFEDFNSEHINGKTFDTQEAAYEFYNQYSLLNGFGTRKHNAHKIMATGAIFRRQFVCNKQGFKKLDDKRLNVWVVDKFQDVHNHPLTTTPSKVIKHRSHSKYHRTNVCKSLVADLNNEGLKPSQITRVVNVMKPSEEADYYSSADVRVSCSCAKFETAGILCKHILYIFKMKKIIDLPEYYILPRWTINARYKVGDVGDKMDEISRYSTEKGVSLLTLWSVRAKFTKAIENAKNSPSEICEIDS